MSAFLKRRPIPRSVTAMRSRLVFDGVVLALMCPGLSVAETRPATQPAPAAPAAVKPPETIEGLQALRDGIAAEMDRLRPATQPTESTPATQAADVIAARQSAAALYMSLQQLLAHVDTHLALRRQIADLRSAERIEAFTAELAAIQNRTKEIAASIADPPRYASAEDIKKVQDEYESRVREISSRRTLQSERAKALAAAPQRRQEAAARVQKAQAEFHDEIAPLLAQLDASINDAERRRIEQRTRKAEIDAGIALFEELEIRLTEERDTILQSQGERRLPLLSDLVRHLGDWRNRLQQIHSRGEREDIEYQLQYIASHPDAVPSYELPFWELRKLEITAREEFGNRERSIRSRFPRSRVEEIKQDAANERAHWDLFMESLDRRSSEHIRDRYWQVQQAIATWRKRLARDRRLLDKTVDERRELIVFIDGLNEEIRIREAELNRRLNERLLQQANDPKAERISQQYADLKRGYTERCQQIQTEISELIARIRTANELAASLIEELERHRSRLYWRHLYVPERPLWTYRWSASLAEWRSDREAAQRERDRRTVGNWLGQLTRWQWTLFGIALASAEALAVWLRRRARRYADAVARRILDAPAPTDPRHAPVADRTHLLLARFGARIAPLAAPVVTMLLFILLYEVTGPVAALIGTVAVLILGLSVTEALIRLLFVPGKPRFRLLPCSNVVALHYRRWGMAAWLATAVMLPVPLLLWTLDWAPYSRSYAWAAYQVVALAMLLVFGFSRQLVLRVVGRPEQLRYRHVFTLIQTAYPLLWAGVAVLFAAVVLGYGALANLVLFGCAATIGTIAVAILLSRYVTDLLIRHWPRGDGEIPEAPSAADSAPGARPRDASASTAEDARTAVEGREVALRAAAVLCRWVIAVAAAMTVLRIWGITGVEVKSLLGYELLSADAGTGRPAITIGRVLAGLAAVVGSLWVSRAIRSILTTQVYPAYGGIDKGVGAAVNTVLHYFIVLLGLYFALFAMQVPLGALTVVLGTVGLGLGLGLQPLFVNFVSGLMILFERHLRVGDIIEVGGQVGEVTSISMRSTSIRTFDNVDLVIPNSDFISHSTINWTLSDSRLRGRIGIGVAYGTDPETVRRLLLDIANRHPLVLRYPPPDVWFTNFGESSLDFELLLWFRSPSDRGTTLNSLRFEILRVFREQGIEIPFPHRTLTTAGNAPLPIQIVPPKDGTPPPGPG